jgi:hypothetical protein
VADYFQFTGPDEMLVSKANFQSDRSVYSCRIEEDTPESVCLLHIPAIHRNLADVSSGPKLLCRLAPAVPNNQKSSRLSQPVPESVVSWLESGIAKR